METITFSSRLHPYLGEGDSFHSPFSIQVAVGMANSGAKGETAEQLSSALCCPLNIKEQNKYFAELVSEIKSTDDYQLTTHNALWAQKGFEFNNEFSENIKNSYCGTFAIVDYINAPNEAVKLINNSCSEATKGKIPSIIRINSVNNDTRLILTNAIYFKGKWQFAFKKENTTNREFKGKIALPLGIKYTSNKVPTMHQVEKFQYYENDQYQALNLPYQGNALSMLILLPKQDTEFIDKNLESSYNETIKGLVTTKVNVYLPKFKLETESNLKEIFCEMGANLAFSDNADFSGISNEKLKISEIIHKAFVEINEEGTEAAAATAVTIIKRCVMSPPKLFDANHPFVFFIRNQVTNTVLFTGRITNPS